MQMEERVIDDESRWWAVGERLGGGMGFCSWTRRAGRWLLIAGGAVRSGGEHTERVQECLVGWREGWVSGPGHPRLGWVIWRVRRARLWTHRIVAAAVVKQGWPVVEVVIVLSRISHYIATWPLSA